MSTINKECCPHCGQTINNRKIALFRGMIGSLKEIYKWCKEKDRHEFSRKDIKHLLKTDGQIARFGDWVLFGGLIYKKEKAEWGMNMERTEAFLSGKLEIPTVVIKNPITKEVVDRLDYRTIKQVKGIEEFLDLFDGSFIAEYVPSKPGQSSLL
jgi:hypothetical protein